MRWSCLSAFAENRIQEAAFYLITRSGEWLLLTTKIGEHFIENAHKPAVRNYERAMELLGTDRSQYHFYRRSAFYGYLWGKKSGDPTVFL